MVNIPCVAALRGAVLLWACLLGSAANAAATLNVGYVPILPMAQLFVMEGEGWATSAGLNLRKTAFAEGPAIISALEKGELDVAYFGIGPTLVARAKGVDIRVVASNVVEQIALVVRGDLTLYMLRSPAAGLQRFRAKTGRKPRIATFSKGSVPDTVLRHWLTKVAKLDKDVVEIVPMGADRVQQALLAGEVDGASILEPVITLVLAQERSAKVILTGGEMMPEQPGSVLAVRGALIRKRPNVVQKLVELHLRATEFLILEPERAAKHVQQALGKDKISLEMAERAITSPYGKFVADPYRIRASTERMHDFQREIGVLKAPVPLDDLFVTRFFDAAAAMR